MKIGYHRIELSKVASHEDIFDYDFIYKYLEIASIVSTSIIERTSNSGLDIRWKLNKSRFNLGLNTGDAHYTLLSVDATK